MAHDTGAAYDPITALAARELFALINKEAPYPPSDAPPDHYGVYGGVISEFRMLHRQAQDMWARGEVCDPWYDAALLWDGYRQEESATDYQTLDDLVRRISGLPPNKKGKIYTPAPSAPIDVNDLLSMERKSTLWYAPSFLREGLGLVVGQPNVGKTPAAIQLAIAIATGDKWLNAVQCRRAKVLYLGMEYSPQELIPMFDISRMGLAIPRDWLLVKTIEDDFPTNADAALQELEWYIQAMDVRVIIIDVLTAFLPPEKFKQNVYRGDYSELKPYHRLALKYNAAILGVWHASKRESDPKIMYNGSTGMWAAAASRITMYQDKEQRTRIASFPRMGDRIDWALTQEKSAAGRRWVLADANPEPVCSPTELQVYRCLRQHADAARPLSSTTIAELTSIPVGTVKTCLHRMFSSNIIQQPPKGTGYFIEVETIETRETTETIEPVEPSTYVKTVSNDSALQSAKTNRFHEFHDSHSFTNPALSIWDCVPPSKQTVLRLYLRSDLEKNQERGMELCEEYGIDYDEARKLARATEEP